MDIVRLYTQIQATPASRSESDLTNHPLNRKVPATSSSQISKKRRRITLESLCDSIHRPSSSGKERSSNMEARLIPEGMIRTSRKLRFDLSVWLLYGVISHIG